MGPEGGKIDGTWTLSRCGRRERGPGSKIAPRLVSGVTRAQGHSWDGQMRAE